jgi:hypothetical protein
VKSVNLWIFEISLGVIPFFKWPWLVNYWQNSSRGI